ncbi:MAG: NADH-quinone oxidoreductase subunit N [Gammaproteobacteria bacterium]|nr:NADH-quinone oxidoreductase subunit N [Gammaproteobacteria bacterium]MDP2140304.1 NADH-quinone oxidoreductase subunit N [Gammaproteobacteria bacterium]MDP2346178.1 NADH-quinone oxidoreductase subunit N [Gammaproteobacteria bacterium]
MTGEQLLLILPLIIVTATSVITMLMVAAKRNHAVSCFITAVGLVLALLSLIIVARHAPQEVTPLLLVDSFNIFFTALILLAGLAITLFSYPYLCNLEDHQDEFYLLLSIATLGALVMVGSTHFITAFLGMETLSVCLYGMVAYPLHRQETAQYPMEASIKYLVLSAVSSGFVLFGVALLYAQIGTLHFADISAGITQGIANGPGSEYFVVASLLVITGFAFKLSLVPFHLWTPDVYEGAPLPATAFLATVGKLAMAALLMRFMSVSGVLQSDAITNVLSIIAVFSILGGNLLALLQANLKRLLSYSSIAHMGYLLIALLTLESATGAASGSPGTSLGAEAVSFYLTAYVVMSLGAFGVMMVVSDSGHERDHIGHYQGLFWRDPWLALVFTAMLLSLAGIPLTIGFIGKFYVFVAGVQGAEWGLLAAMVIGSGIGLFYYLRIVYRMLTPLDHDDPLPVAGIRDVIPHGILLVLLVALIVPGIIPGSLMALLQSVVQSL